MFSVVIPSYNHIGFLPEAIASAMTEKSVGEILIADDGSTDGSASMIERLSRIHAPRIVNLTRYPVRNVGAHSTMNDLISAARFDWIAVLNSDDKFTAGRFSAIQNQLRAAEFDFCFGNLFIINGKSEVIGHKRAFKDPQFPFADDLPPLDARPDSLLGGLLCQNYIATTSNMTFTKALWEAVGGFRSFRYVHDWDFALRSMLIGNAYYIDEYMAFYRNHDANTIRTGREAQTIEVKRLFAQLQAEFGGGMFQKHKTDIAANAYLSA